ncbi:hypothetical protein TWF102_004897 [Orbilia oligospora]|uniref:Dienelactone hydrolase domain-containing protein n=1 Tax=Orbilia oligospora TaxID=2813651 RepID=A0A7C8J899_ORBOL|nr:hypothetical protein TWF102_004897 [Orbilia oligospora]KAF3118378.1 hypothetical protein TWF103_000382 [Orbilia oligospora]KAF3149229.1 hypothetical protein TWF594_011280 [Orbilia oligospora]
MSSDAAATTSSDDFSASAHLRTGAPDGKFEEIGGRRTYVAQAPDGSKAKTLIYLTDMFGVDLLNHQLLADTYAKGGFHVLMPDILDGDGLPAEFINTAEPKLSAQEKMTVIEKATNHATLMATMGPKGIKHREAVSKPKVDAFIASVRQDPAISNLGIIGTCWGGRHAVLQARPDTGITAVAALQPSFTAAGDWEAVSVPIYVAFGSKDTIVPVSPTTAASLFTGEDAGTKGPTSMLSLSVDGIIDVMEKKLDVQKEIRIFENQVHGFTHRGDWSSDNDRKAMDEAAEEVIGWFKKYLA